MKISENRDLIFYVKDFARHPFSSVGGYPKVLIMRDGGCLCTEIQSAYGDPEEGEV